ncbi:hypothetical protein NXZ77_02065 [Lysinibacillus boronitolerans]|uniref:hypothetical protein n=1 Tax=Lysinibacillus boronitolerans TaxID=309788 RepID=UPI0021626CEC|nr:hypothetical protein [Lysinibacillus boronitolerans]MCS1390387.1 hypothetical protein [Lysinibacillus boronitolerans]
MEIKEQILHLLLQKGFNFRYYEDQKLRFYTKEITEPSVVKWFAQENSDLEEGYDLTNISITIEIMDDFKNAQYVFINGTEKDYQYEDLAEFKEMLEKLPNQVELR